MPRYISTHNLYNSENRKDWNVANIHSTEKSNVWMTSGTIDAVMKEHEKATTERKKTKKDVVAEYQCV